MRMIFVNLPVQDATTTRAFWTSLGFTVDERFSDERTVSVVVSDAIVLMLLERSRFADFVTGPVADPRQGTGALHALSADSREEVDELVDRALAAGAGAWLPAMDHGIMYGRSFQDPDGHVWEVVWMDVEAMTAGGAPEMSAASS